jgi:recombination associated protein RdgC
MFKNAIPYRLDDWNITAEQLAEQLGRRCLVQPGAQDAMSRGWVAPVADGELVHAVAGRWLIAMGVETKILPAQVVNREAQARADEMARAQGYCLGRKQMRELRDSVTAELLPRAFTRPSRTLAWIDPDAGLLVVDASSTARAEDLLELLRQTLDTFPLALLRTELSPAWAMADWLTNEAPAGFTVDDETELCAATEGRASVRYVHHSLDGADVRAHMAEGKMPTRLALTFNDRVSFMLTEKLEIKRLDFLDVIHEQINAAAANDARELFDAEFALLASEQVALIAGLVDALGGVVGQERG